MLGGYADFLYQTSMVDELQREYVKQQTDAGVKFIQQEKWIEAFEVRLLQCLFLFPKKLVLKLLAKLL